MQNIANYEHGKTVIDSVDGLWWHETPLPKRWHRCKVHTQGTTNWFNQVYRCACGAISRDGKRWSEKNSRRK